MTEPFELFAFYSDQKRLIDLIDADVDGIIIDWESYGKHNRQELFDTQVNEHGLQDLKTVSLHGPKQIICRVNGPDYLNLQEIDLAIDNGATEILVPMIRSFDQAKSIIDLIKGRVHVSFMIETIEALEITSELNKLEVKRFFVGLNDLSIARGSNSLFIPLIDGTIEKLRPNITKGFGIAGLTHPDSGFPIPCQQLIKVMKQFKASYGFLRRSFYRDLNKYSIKEIIDALKAEFQKPENESAYYLNEKERSRFNQPLI
ncbi:MAG: hypothetical protein HKN00_13635 [Flavobacteriaceae bacterium]|nr:hypothetical protein [Flavobacteriaceae bacterium]